MTRPPTPRERALARVVVYGGGGVAAGAVLAWLAWSVWTVVSQAIWRNHTGDPLWVTTGAIGGAAGAIGLATRLAVCGLCRLVLWLHWAMTTPPSKPAGRFDEV